MESGSGSVECGVRYNALMCQACTRRVALYNAARYRKAPKPWPAKVMCPRCRKALRKPRARWQRDYRLRKAG